jgi:hypothetical protein
MVFFVLHPSDASELSDSSLACCNELMMTTVAINENNCEHTLSSTLVILFVVQKIRILP